MELKGTSVLVTGGSRGLGAALVHALAREGARVVAVARGKEALEEVVNAARAEGGEVHALVADVADKDATYAIAGSAAALVGPVDVLIHNASTLGALPMPALLDTECEDLQQVLEVNVVGPFRLTKAVAGSMALRGRGTVVHITSDAAVNAYPGWGAYGVSKAALEHLGRIWAAELEGKGVRFVTVDPGEMDTKMHADAMPDADRASLARPGEVARKIVQVLKEAAPPARVEAARMAS
jgi:NAD(P)-dependent dehydrogenase (short-subunit alcohol dehydrogenase family)